MFKQQIDVLQSYRSLRALQFSYKLYLHPISYVKVTIL
ncbi:Ankyrin repeat domain-containing protein 2A [Zea mays]|uniref:Ankyrin repeat domain-containing protein 2A n=1 Tax=Zea mays TaxID=4577 RepID=A0A1D6QIZ5_MAIZE|nr:Ankyrin repeat domain-containing protein 2A [Zea mays]